MGFPSIRSLALPVSDLSTHISQTFQNSQGACSTVEPAANVQSKQNPERSWPRRGLGAARLVFGHCGELIRLPPSPISNFSILCLFALLAFGLEGEMSIRGMDSRHGFPFFGFQSTRDEAVYSDLVLPPTAIVHNSQ